ncbi:MAG: 3-methyl-2-oxobutanoate hydroxymethyltransferase [Fermentimonas sp.]|jgi:3-methyl-2-oxobutanoate hydroxymethyltransferase|nr:3-methyl-2-oxobutanoate hydroxymethyltransferase [Fermentimonas sp.]NLC85999.1 3-methyl-2-oxobutanoate hydroxymethyltransferase [Bacteroidales bacterium]HBT86282.1 3-methyl-2-oxobutanoate hydroxymethyltransferase [Porphyromonadaceae bacterium]MDD2930160.1 3-methyl-2-oxobutanoate hydroxymethyltransferase [Fermentimonas sp.]MDD3188749.1 3-methyl-2-oxobutanoate hydroxymethyltransferase [Fermentimonas sp.]
MSQEKGYLSNENRKKVTTHRLMEMKQNGEKISMLTAYDYSMASIIDKAGMDVILVGDSASNVMVGNSTTLPMTVDQMIHHGRSVTNGVEKAMVVVDMPFGSYHASTHEAVTNAVKIMRETEADCLKLEGGVEIIDAVRAILAAGIPIMGHLGLMPQSINKYGSYALRAKDSDEANKLISDAKLLEEAGCCGVVLEKIPAELAKKVTKALIIPTIGIGAGPYVDGQVLVMHDMLGLNKGFSPKFLRRYANLYDIITEAVQGYISDVKSSDFPSLDESY